MCGGPGIICMGPPIGGLMPPKSHSERIHNLGIHLWHQLYIKSHLKLKTSFKNKLAKIIHLTSLKGSMCQKIFAHNQKTENSDLIGFCLQLMSIV